LASLHDQPRDLPQSPTTCSSQHTCDSRLHDLDLISRLVSRTQQVPQILRIDQDASEGDCLGVDTEQSVLVCPLQRDAELLGTSLSALCSAGRVSKRGKEEPHRELQFPGVERDAMEPELSTHPSLCATELRVPGHVDVTSGEMPASMM